MEEAVEEDKQPIEFNNIDMTNDFLMMSLLFCRSSSSLDNYSSTICSNLKFSPKRSISLASLLNDG